VDAIVLGLGVACWSVVLVVWIVVAARDAGTRPAGRVRGSTDIGSTVLAFLAVTALVLIGRDPSILAPLTVSSPLVAVIGAAILAGSTVFAVWARLALGRSWSVDPRAAPDVGLHTDGPYAVTRHPIYTGLLGMMLGTALMGGLGQWITLVIAGLVVAGIKIRAEERLLLATFPDAYSDYRKRVPALIPRWRVPSAGH
jgi:protein-S-isoprenylcysteine O-methyltransferase Ste14